MGAVITTTAPYDVVATGFEDASGMAVQGDGSIFVVDRRAGTLERIAPGGGRQVLISNLRAALPSHPVVCWCSTTTACCSSIRMVWCPPYR
jgi:glucose/arabinose dehydrogenase